MLSAVDNELAAFLDDFSIQTEDVSIDDSGDDTIEVPPNNGNMCDDCDDACSDYGDF